jgi:hypothetical protein
MKRTVVLALTLALSPLSLNAQGRPGSLGQQIGSLAAAVLGYPTAVETFSGMLSSERSETRVLRLDPNLEHLVLAACDADCPDVDLALYETSGDVVASDRDLDAFPALFIPAGHTGNHSLVVTMARCSIAPCRYDVAVYSRPSTTTRR